MIQFRTVGSVALVMVLALPMGCDKSESTQPTTEPVSQPIVAPSDDTAKDGKRDSKRGMRGMRGMRASGNLGIMVGAAEKLTLDDAQKTKLETLGTAVSMDATREASQKLHQSVAAAMKTGTIDTAKLEPELAALDAAAKTRRDAEAKALNELHALLSAEQRKALVASVRESHVARMERGGAADKPEPPPEGARSRGKLRASPDRGDRGRRARGPGGRMGLHGVGGVERLEKELSLTPEQVKQVTALQEKAEGAKEKPDLEAIREAHKVQGEALLVAFEKDTFDAAKIELAKAPMQEMMGREGATKMIEHLKELAAILTPEQREKLGTRMAEAPAQRHGGGSRPGLGMNAADDANEADDDSAK